MEWGMQIFMSKRNRSRKKLMRDGTEIGKGWNENEAEMEWNTWLHSPC